MEEMTRQEAVEQQIKEKDLVILYFTGSACGACEVIKMKVESVLCQYPSVQAIEINGAKYPEVAACYEVYALPLIILFVQGKESIRVGRNLDLLEFERKLVRYMNMMNPR